MVVNVHQMFVSIRHLREPLLADVALERLFASVLAVVAGDVAGAVEQLVAPLVGTAVLFYFLSLPSVEKRDDLKDVGQASLGLCL